MAIADRINEMYTHVGDVYDTITNVDLPTNKNIQNIPQTIKDSYLEIMNNGIDRIWNNWEKVTGEGTSLTLNNTYQAPMRNNLKGNTSQTGTPTPTSPIPVNVVSGDNEIQVCGKNLCNNDIILSFFLNFTNSTIGEAEGSKTMYAKVPKNTDITISRATLTNRFRIGLLNEIPQNGGTFYLAYNGDSSSDLSKTINSGNYEYVAVQYTNQSENTNIQIEKGNQATNFEPYQGNTYNINLPSGMELCKIGTYQDYIYKDSDKWYLYKEIGKYTFTGASSEDWRVFAGTNYEYQVITSTAGSSDIEGQYFLSLSNKYLNHNVVSSSLGNYEYSHFMSGGFRWFRVRHNDITTLANYKTWLASNTPTFYSPLATPTNTEITDTTLINQLEEFYQAQSKNNQTNISQVNNDLPFIISASALKKG